jgi:hypothetical protein
LARVSPVLTRPRPQDARTRFGRDIALLLAGAVVALAVIIGVSAAVEGPTYVDRISIRNATPYAIDVEVSNGDRDGWTNLGPVSPNERHAFRTVVDKGDRWVVRVSSAKIDGGQVEVGRDQIARRGWEITIGDEISGRLAENGATSAPPRE